MLVRAASVGILPRDAMRMTLRELDLFAQGVNKHRRETYRQQIAVSHLNAKLARAKKIPPLANVLSKMAPEEQTTFAPVNERKAQFWATVQGLARKGELKTVKGKKKK